MENFDDEFLRRILNIQMRTPSPVAVVPTEDPVLTRLKKHRFYKAVLKCTAENPVRRRVTNCRFGPDIEVPSPQPQDVVKPTEENRMDNLDSQRHEVDNLKEKDPRDCLAHRASLRKCIDNMGDLIQWLKNKPVRSGQEERFLDKGKQREKLEEIFGTGDDVGNCKMAYEYFLNKAKKGDKFVARETVGLHILDEYLLKNNEDLFQFFCALDQSKSGNLEWKTISNALQKGKIPLETHEILQGITVLKCDEREGVNYESLCEKMENFRKYKYRRLISKTDEFCHDLVESLEASKDYQIEDFGIKRVKPRSRSGTSLIDEMSGSSSAVKMLRKMSENPHRGQSWRQVAARYLQQESPEPRRKTRKSKFWPGALLDKIRPCYMPEDRGPMERHHPIFEIIRTDVPVRKPPMRLPPFTHYSVYGDGKKI